MNPNDVTPKEFGQRTPDEEAIIRAQLTGELPEMMTSRQAVEVYRKMKEIVGRERHKPDHASTT